MDNDVSPPDLDIDTTARQENQSDVGGPNPSPSLSYTCSFDGKRFRIVNVVDNQDPPRPSTEVPPDQIGWDTSPMERLLDLRLRRPDLASKTQHLVSESYLVGTRNPPNVS